MAPAQTPRPEGAPEGSQGYHPWIGGEASSPALKGRRKPGPLPHTPTAYLTGPVAALTALVDYWTQLPDLRLHADALRQALAAYTAALIRPDRPLVMGILNVTPDSFSDGGQLLNPEDAIRRGLQMVEEGADILDLGGESTRPGAAEVSEEEELRRVLPVVRGLAGEVRVPLSIDTRKAAVAEACLDAGATIVNDVSALTHDPRMAPVAAAAPHAVVILMHMPGDPATMQSMTHYDDVLADTARALRRQADAAVAAGIDPGNLWIDPGFGFGKTAAQNLEILRRLREYTSIGLPLVIGTSRKSTIGRVLDDAPPDDRLEGTAATVAAAVLNGASVVRVHDVRPMARVVRMTWAIARGME